MNFKKLRLTFVLNLVKFYRNASIQRACGNECLSHTQVYKWFKSGLETIYDNEKSGCSKTGMRLTSKKCVILSKKTGNLS